MPVGLILEEQVPCQEEREEAWASEAYLCDRNKWVVFTSFDRISTFEFSFTQKWHYVNILDNISTVNVFKMQVVNFPQAATMETHLLS